MIRLGEAPLATRYLGQNIQSHFRVVVTGTTGARVAGATVWLTVNGLKRQGVVTDSLGIAEFTFNIPPGSKITVLEAEAPGYLPAKEVRAEGTALLPHTTMSIEEFSAEGEPSADLLMQASEANEGAPLGIPIWGWIAGGLGLVGVIALASKSKR